MGRPSGYKYRAFLRGDITASDSKGNGQWRKSIPFTDDQIADALEQLAAEVKAANPFMASHFLACATSARAGRVGGRGIIAALQVLVKTCFCGKKALYLTGSEGRCSKHRLVKSQEEIQRIKSLETKNAIFEQDSRAIDELGMKRRRHRTIRIAKNQ